VIHEHVDRAIAHDLISDITAGRGPHVPRLGNLHHAHRMPDQERRD
jgi:hypothetical protein